MAYKDEYEVARLHLEEAVRLQVENAVGSDVKVSYNLHPPMLRAMGMDKKVRLSGRVPSPCSGASGPASGCGAPGSTRSGTPRSAASSGRSSRSTASSSTGWRRR